MHLKRHAKLFRAACAAAPIGFFLSGQLLPERLKAATFTYTPTATGGDPWSTSVNWSAAPPVSAADTTLVFVGDNTTLIPAGQPTATSNDIAGNFLLNRLDLQGTGPATGAAPTISISGNPLEFVANGGSDPVINLNSLDGPVDVVYSTSNDVVLTNNLTIAGNGDSAFTFSGAIGGPGSIIKTGTGTILLSGANVERRV